MSARRLAVCCCMLIVAAGVADARPFRRGGRSSSISQRSRLTVNSLVAEPGTFETEWYGSFYVNGDSAIPTTWKFTPGGSNWYWGRTELSATFDGLAAAAAGGTRAVHFSDHLNLAATTALPSLGRLQLAAAPLATVWLRNDRGVRLGAALLGRFDTELYQAGVLASWTGANRASATNPAGTFDLSGALGRHLGATGLAHRLTVHGSVLWESGTGNAATTAISEGLEYQVLRRLALDVSGQHSGLRTGQADHQVIVGVTWNLGRPSNWWR